MNLFHENQLLIATHNTGKLEEFKDLLKDLDLKILSSKDLDLDEPNETENTFIGNARIKSKISCSNTSRLSLRKNIFYRSSFCCLYFPRLDSLIGSMVFS